MVEWSVCPMWFDIWLAVGREGGGGKPFKEGNSTR